MLAVSLEQSEPKPKSISTSPIGPLNDTLLAYLTLRDLCWISDKYYAFLPNLQFYFYYESSTKCLIGGFDCYVCNFYISLIAFILYRLYITSIFLPIFSEFNNVVYSELRYVYINYS